MLNPYTLLRSNTPLLVSTIGALCLFGVNFVSKKNFSDQEFGLISLMLVNYVILISFGLLGIENTFIRNLKYRNGILSTPLNTFFLTGAFAGFTALTSTFYFGRQILLISSPLYLVFVLLINSSIVLYQVLRGIKRYNTSMCILAVPKIILFSVLVYLFFTHQLTILNFYYSFVFALIVVNVIGLINLLDIKFNFYKASKKKIKADLFLTLSFLIATLTITLLNQGDKIIIREKINMTVMGNYFFCASIVLFPYNLLQQYITFKGLVEFKKHIPLKSLLSAISTNTIRAILLGIILYITLPYLRFISDKFDFLATFDETLLLSLIFIGVIKITYSYLSSIVGAKAPFKTIILINVISIIIFLLNYRLFNLIGFNVNTVALFFCILWVARTLIFSIISFKLSSVNKD